MSRAWAYGAVAIVVAVALAFFVIYLIGIPGFNQSEKASFNYQAQFVYCSSESNLPIDNIVLRFPYPKIENETSSIESRGFMTLFWMDSNGTRFPEITMNSDGTIIQVSAYYGNRRENLVVFLSGIEPTTYGPKLYYNIDRLYSGEGILIDALVLSPIEFAEKTTLIDTNENNRTNAYYNHIPIKVESIELLFQASLQRKIDDKTVPIENFVRVYSNGNTGWYWLYPQ